MIVLNFCDKWDSTSVLPIRNIIHVNMFTMELMFIMFLIGSTDVLSYL